MGYTHYWYLAQSRTGRISEDALAKVRAVIAKYRGILAYETDEPNKSPVVSPNLIRFNGIGGSGYETFYFEYPPDASSQRQRWQVYGGADANGPIFSFCKTANHAYDPAVCECLLILKADLGPAMTLSSDGVGSPTDIDRGWQGPMDIMRGMGYTVSIRDKEIFVDKPVTVVQHMREGRPVRQHRRRK